MKKRLLSILLALCLVAGLLPTAALADETPSYSIDANGILVISGTTDGSDLPTEGFTSIEITTTGVVTGGTYTAYVENYGTIKDGNFGEVMNRNGGAGSGLALIEGGTFEKVSNYGNMTGGTVKDLTTFDTTNYGHTVKGVTVTGSLYNYNSVCYDMILRIDLDSVDNAFGGITYVSMTVDGEPKSCPVGQNADSWLKSNVANADWYQLNGEEWVKLTDTDVFPCEKRVYSKIPSMSLGTMGSMLDIISGKWIVPVADSGDNPNVINRVFNGKIGVFNSSAVWYVAGQPVEGKFSPPAMSYTVTEADIGKDAVAKLTDGYATIQSPTIRIVESLSVTVPATSAVGETITPVFNWKLKTNYSEGMTYQWQRDGVDIEGATSYTYTATEFDLNRKLTLKIFVKGTHYYTTDEVAVAALHTHCICGGDTDVGDHTSHTDVTYQPWDGTSDIDYGDDNIAYVCLTNDVTIQKNLEITGGKTLYLCLNGKTFASNGTSKIVVKENSRFILCDCAGGGTIDGANIGWGGTGVYLYNSTMDMYGGKITGGYASGNGGGGAIALDDVNCVFNMYGGEISGNEANRTGGAIFLNGKLQTQKGGTVNIYGGTIKYNRAQIGGAIYAVYGGTVNLFGGEISNNTAIVYGGGAICLNHSGVLNMTGGKMQNNMANTDGGAVNLYASTFTFSDGIISNNDAGDYGGAVYLSKSCTLNMTGGEICNNTADAEGGAVHVYGKNSIFNFSGGTITGNEAVDGGAVYLNQENSTLNMTGGEISGNKATRNGGAVYMYRETSTLNLSGGTIKNNTAGSSGGAVYFNTTSDGKIQGILNISGNPVVKDNTVSGKANNISLKTGKTLSIVDAMTDGASVGITTESTDYPVVFSNAYDTDYSGYFFADDLNAYVRQDSGYRLELATGTPHTHSWAEDWSNNKTHHWHECTADGCDVTNNADKNGYATHTYDQEIATADYKASDATCTAKATYYKSCICGAKGTETFESGEVNASNHTFGDWIDEVPATCKTTGTKGHRDCTSCGKHFDASNNEITDLTIPVDSANHEGTLGDWQTDPDKHWKEYSCCSAKVEEGTHIYTDDTDTTCNTCGYIRTIEPAHTHSWAEDWSNNETHHWHECTADGCDVTNDADKDGYAEHTYDQEIATADYKASDATCTAKATYYKSCICGAKGTETFESGEVNASNHTFGDWIDEVPATCKTTGTKGHRDCTSCGKHFDASNNEITDLTIPVDPANHEGTLGDWVKTDPDKHWKEYSCCSAKVDEGDHTTSDWITDTAATATTDGTKYKKCTVCHRVLKTGTIPATGYTITFDANGGSVTPESAKTNAEGKLTSLPTPTRSGSYSFDGWYTAASGGNKITTDYVFSADTTVHAHWRYTGSTGSSSGVSTYTIKVEKTDNGDVTSSHKSASKGTTVTITVEPDKGYTLETITVTDKNGDEIELTNKGDGKYTFKMPASKVYVEATFMEDNSMLNFFVDVPADAYYYDAVLWAAENGITGGVDDVHFAPNAPCTRAQIVTFLWRAAGSPAPKSSEMPFEDVVKGSYYYDAVSWAVENGITKGTSDTTFSPDATCTRGQIVTFLWRAQQSPAAGSTNPFADVAADAYYADAVLWAVREDITNGTSSTTFSPDATCTRAQIVTFLYRCLTGE